MLGKIKKALVYKFVDIILPLINAFSAIYLAVAMGDSTLLKQRGSFEDMKTLRAITKAGLLSGGDPDKAFEILKEIDPVLYEEMMEDR